jgi:YegS/Rv2252/BmrU family lipid kinase
VTNATVILNPIAGRGAGTRLRPRIVEWLQGYGLDFRLETTIAPKHATALAREAVRSGSEKVIAVGGDGTANEVLNGLMRAQDSPDDTALGILPIGTGNDFAFGAGLSLDLRKACEVVAQDQTRILDVGWIQAENAEACYFGNGMGLGFDAIANIESRKVKRLRGSLVYLVAVLKTLAFYYQSPQVTMCVDGQEFVQNSLMISIMNGRRMGGAFYTTPDSLMDDGLFDLCMAGQVSRLRMVGFVPQFMRGSHTTDPNVTMCRGQKVTVSSESPWPAQVDGEIYSVDGRHFEVNLLPQRLRILCDSAYK